LSSGSKSKGSSTTSVNIPADLPEIGPEIKGEGEEEEAWEKRATILAKSNPNTPGEGKEAVGMGVSDQTGDVCYPRWQLSL